MNMNLHARVLRAITPEFQTGIEIYKRVKTDGHGRVSRAAVYLAMRDMEEMRRVECRLHFDMDGPLKRYRLA